MEDLQQEIVDKDEKLKQKEEISLKLSNSSLFDELANAQSENRKTQLEAKIEILEKKVKNAEIQKMKRTNMMNKLKSLHDQNQESLLELQKKVEIWSKTKPMEKCRFGSNCKFDHSFVYHKVNNHRITSKFSCCKCGENFKAKNNLAIHLINHEELKMGTDPEEISEKHLFKEHIAKEFEDCEKVSENTSTDKSSNDQTSNEENTSTNLSPFDRISRGSSKTESENGEICSSSENPSISSGGNVIDQLIRLVLGCDHVYKCLCNSLILVSYQ